MTKITTGDFLTIEYDNNLSTIELTKWVCDKVHDQLQISNAYGSPIVLKKGTFLLDNVETSDLSVIRAAVGANW